MHDLRNPVHSIRISMELFGRLARRTGDVDKLMERAAAYIDPAEAAVQNLVTNTERLARYLAVAGPAELQPFPVEEMVAEVILLLRAAKRRLPVTSTVPGDAALNVRADRIRVCHVLLHTCLNNPAAAVAIAVRDGTNGLVVFDVVFQAGAGEEAPRATALRPEEIQSIVETAGGAMLAATQAALSMEFRRADALPHG